MHRQWPFVLMVALIIAGQLALLAMGLDWYPDLVARVAASRHGTSSLGWTLLMSAVVVSPVLLLVAPYAIVKSLWQTLQAPSWRLTA